VVLEELGPSEVDAADPLPPPSPGPPERLGDYRILREIGRGGMGVVYEAMQQSLGRRVALKVLPVQAAADARVLKRFRRESRAAAGLHHTNIVPVFDVGREGDVCYFAMQFIQGQGLDEVLKELRRLRAAGATTPDAGPVAQSLWTGQFAALGNGVAPAPGPGAGADETERLAGPAAPAVLPGQSELSGVESNYRRYCRNAARIGLQVAEALAYAHARGVIHRDVKPSNLLLDTAGVVWVSDFGLAQTEDHGLSKPGEVVGTLRYLAPERFRGACDARADVYALGLTLYELLTLRPAFGGSDRLRLLEQITTQEPARPRSLDRRIPRDLETVVFKAIAKDPTRRYPTAEALAADLRRFLADEAPRARRTGWLERLWRLGRRNPLVASLCLALGLVFLSGFAGVAWKWREAEQARQDEQIARTEADTARRLAEDRAGQIRQDLQRLETANALLRRGQVFGDWLCWDDADAALTKAIRLRPEQAALWTARGDLYTRLGLWELAGADLAQAVQLHEPEESPRWYQHALLCLSNGNRNGYRQACARMHDRFYGTTNPVSAVELVRAGVLAPDPDTDAAALVDLAQGITDLDPREAWYRYVLGLALYRAGQDERAVQQLRESLEMNPNWPARGINYPVLAMAYYRLGRTVEARQALDDAAQAIDRWAQDRYQSGSGRWVVHQGATGFWPVPWWDWVEGHLYYREARARMGLPPPPDDPRLHVLRGRAFAGLRWPRHAVAEYAAASNLSPRDPQIRLETHRSLGLSFVQFRLWHQAAAEFAQASELALDDPDLWEWQAVAHLAAGDRGAYRRACAGMLERFRQTQDPIAATQVVETCVLQPEAVADPEQLLPVARVAARWYQGSVRILAAAHYRAGHDAESVRHFQEAARVSRLRASDWFFLAMAQHRLGRAEEGRTALAKALAWIDEANRQGPDDLSGTQPIWDNWHQVTDVSLLRGEAEALIQGNADRLHKEPGVRSQGSEHDGT
jgi:serine/threonine protein kinase/tetratricopeptide (TPR) repeat protein